MDLFNYRSQSLKCFTELYARYLLTHFPGVDARSNNWIMKEVYNWNSFVRRYPQDMRNSVPSHEDSILASFLIQFHFVVY